MASDHQYQQNIHTTDRDSTKPYGRFQDNPNKNPNFHQQITNKVPYNNYNNNRYGYGYQQDDNNYYYGGGGSTSKVVGLLALLPVGGTLLLLSGLTFVATVVGLALATPLFVIFSPVLVPAAIAIALAVAGFVASGAFGVSAVAALAWMVTYVRGAMPEARGRMEDALDYVGQRTKEAGQGIQNKAHENEYYGRDREGVIKSQGVEQGRARAQIGL